MVASSSTPCCNCKKQPPMVVLDARTQQVLIDQQVPVFKFVRLAKMSQIMYELLKKMFHIVAEILLRRVEQKRGGWSISDQFTQY